MGILDLFKSKSAKVADLDEAVLVQLRKAGSDLTKIHGIEFFLYFPSQSAAEQTANQIRESGFEARVDRAAQGDSWLCFATRQMIPDLSNLQEIRRDFNALAARNSGEYDGWGTEIVK